MPPLHPPHPTPPHHLPQEHRTWNRQSQLYLRWPTGQQILRNAEQGTVALLLPEQTMPGGSTPRSLLTAGNSSQTSICHTQSCFSPEQTNPSFPDQVRNTVQDYAMLFWRFSFLISSWICVIFFTPGLKQCCHIFLCLWYSGNYPYPFLLLFFSSFSSSIHICENAMFSFSDLSGVENNNSKSH